MSSNLFGKTITIVGGSGYIGLSIAREAANLGAKVNAVSRSGEPKYQFDEPWARKIKWYKGDAMFPRTFENILEESDAVVHAIGASLDTVFSNLKAPGSEGSYEQVNYETAKNIGLKLNEFKTDKKLVFLSASSQIPFIPRFRESKWKAEEFLFDLPDIRTTVLRPGYVYSPDQPLKYTFSFLVSAYAYLFAFTNGVTPYESNFKQWLKKVMVS